MKVRSTLIYNNMGLVNNCTSKMWTKFIKSRAMKDFSLDSQDLRQEGVAGLSRAIEKWSKDGGASIATYGTHWINSFMYRFMFANQNLIRAPEHHGFNGFYFSSFESEKIEEIFADATTENNEEKSEFLDRLLDECEYHLPYRSYFFLLLRFRLEKFRVARLETRG